MNIETVRARTVLLDAPEALGGHLPSIILVGAQAIYRRTGAAEVALAEFTTDADLVIDPRSLSPNPLIEDAMTVAGFVRDPSNINPGTWISRDGIPVDLMVPDQVAGKGRRGVTVGPHDRGSMRRTVGLEATLVDNGILSVAGLADNDGRRIDVRVAGTAGLLVAKLHKVSERLETPRRRDDKDAHDIYRILVAISTEDLVDTFRVLLNDVVSEAVTSDALSMLERVFASGPEAPGSTMAGRAEHAIGDPEQVSLAVSILAADLMKALDR
ncbi:hypothetical protein [Microbacterium profundi]